MKMIKCDWCGKVLPTNKMFGISIGNLDEDGNFSDEVYCADICPSCKKSVGGKK